MSAEDWVEVAFLPAAKYIVDWSEDRDGWVVLAQTDRGVFS